MRMVWVPKTTMPAERYKHGAAGLQPSDPAVDAYLAEVLAVSRKHGLIIGHEDQHGGFEVRPISDHGIEWLLAASDERENPR